MEMSLEYSVPINSSHISLLSTPAIGFLESFTLVGNYLMWALPSALPSRLSDRLEDKWLTMENSYLGVRLELLIMFTVEHANLCFIL